MKFSLNWLREFVDTKGLDPQKIGKSLTLHTCELEEIIPVAQNFNRVVAGKLLSFEKIKDTENLHIGTFDCGKKEGKKQIVFGSVFELKKGTVYPVALDSAKLASGLEIKNTTVKGMKSEGMVCTCPELGMKQESLLTFSDSDVGKPLPEIIPEWNDIIFDIDNKSLTHRPDLTGHRGMAREISAIWNKPFESHLFAPEIKGEKPFPVKIETNKCRRFCAIRLDNIKIEPSDLSTQIRLENIGIRAISNLVDLTNVSLAGFGQPMHVFDADKVKGCIIIRMAKKGEKLIALDEEEYTLTENDIVVADEEKVLSIAGIMGGLESSVTKKTKNIVFESANFDPATIRHTSARLGLRSESSMRYEKSLDPDHCKETILWATGKTQQLCPDAKVVSSVGDNYPHPFPIINIDLPPELVRTKSGIDMNNDAIINHLNSLGFETHVTGATIKVNVPSWRGTKDINIPEDLVEEVVRLYGFDAVPSVLPTLPVTPPRRNLLRELEWNIRDLCCAAGRNEVYLTSFAGPQDDEWLGDKTHVTVQNGANEEYEKLRKTLLSNAIRGIESELRSQGKTDLFEIGTVFSALEKETRNLLLCTGEMNGNAVNLFFQQKSELLHLFQSLGMKVDIRPCSQTSNIMHPAQCADIFSEKKHLGNIAVLHPTKNPIRNSVIVFTELNLNILTEVTQNTEVKYAARSAFPKVHRDLSLVVPKEIRQADIVSEIEKTSSIVQSIDLLDVFTDAEKLGEENKNITFHLALQSAEKTLTDTDVESTMKAIETALHKKHRAQLRLAFDQKKS